MRTAVVTVCAGRHAHLRRQAHELARTPGVGRRIVVAMGDGEAAFCRTADPAAELLEVPLAADGLPLAAARNRGAAHALARGAELLVFLDVDCLPAHDLVTGYAAAARAVPGSLLCGSVAYLPPPPRGGYPDVAALPRLAEPHPARPAPPPGAIQAGGDHRLFWSLSFAVEAATWRRIGGFDEAYTGYGGEDTDLGQRARVAGVPLVWVGGARAFHQHHPTSTPPSPHLLSIARNAERFRRRWGWWPMRGWLDAFAARGLIAPVDDAASELRVLAADGRPCPAA